MERSLDTRRADRCNIERSKGAYRRLDKHTHAHGRHRHDSIIAHVAYLVKIIVPLIRALSAGINFYRHLALLWR